MAFGDTRNAAFNKSIQRLLDYFLEQKLAKQRYAMMGELETQRQAGEEALVKQRLAGGQALKETENKNLQDRMWKGWIYQISRDPEISALQSDIFVDKKAGLDTSKKEMDLGDIVASRGQAALKAVKGTLTDSDMNQIMRLSDTTARTLLSEYGTTTRQKEMIERVHEPSQYLQAIGVGQREKEIGLKGRELGLKGQEQVGKLTDQEKATISLVGDTKKFLIGEGVKPTEAGQLMKDMATGRVLDPLSAQNRGMALQWLNTIEFKIINKKALTPNDERFMTTVMNTSGIEPSTPSGEIPSTVPSGRPVPGGLVSPETGLTGGEDQKINTVIEQKVKDRMYSIIYQGFKNRGFSDEAAAFNARNLLTQLK